MGLQTPVNAFLLTTTISTRLIVRLNVVFGHLHVKIASFVKRALTTENDMRHTASATGSSENHNISRAECTYKKKGHEIKTFFGGEKSLSKEITIHYNNLTLREVILAPRNPVETIPAK